ncbi:hypothetical protein QUA08_13915 [Microcoleus sp. T3B2]|uniref:hypothetical protein n=1 Tax=Microcoleus sp. T3B2 TaxID=3055426 RepID=UPI002FD0393A
MKRIILDPNNLNRNRTLAAFEKVNKDLLVKIRADRTYKMPPNYINWQILSGIAAIALSTCEPDYAKIDVSAFIHSYRTALWFAQDAPIYCLTKELIGAFDRTDALHKPGILAGWQPSLPTFMLAIPKGLIFTPDGGEIDYLTVSCSDCEHPEWNRGKWRHVEIEPFNLKHHLYFQICTVDSNETVWTSGTAIGDNGVLIYDETSSIGKSIMSPADKEFVQRIRNLVINALLALEFSPSLLTDVTENEAKTKSKGFAIERTSSNTRYPRWFGKNYQSQSVLSTGKGTHLSPCTHWRRGHWRVLESCEGKRWRDTKRLWIEPVLVNP